MILGARSPAKMVAVGIALTISADVVSTLTIKHLYCCFNPKLEYIFTHVLLWILDAH